MQTVLYSPCKTKTRVSKVPQIYFFFPLPLILFVPPFPGAQNKKHTKRGEKTIIFRVSLDKQNQHRRYKISYTRHMLHLRRGFPRLKHTSVVVKKQKKRLPTNRRPSNAGEDCLFEPCRALQTPATGVQPLKVLSVHHELLKAHDRINLPSLRLVHIRY